jgi:2'-5' RNA ligase
MRLFTALDPPSPVRTQCAALQDALQGGLSLPARWTHPEQFHVTIRFLGETDPDRAHRYKMALSRVDIPAARCVPYGLDVLPSRRTPRVVILGLERTASLRTLYQAVSDALEAEGLSSEDRTYRPHLTLARLDDPDPERVHKALRAIQDAAVDTFQADTLILYESTRTPDGAVHNRRASVGLRRPSS